MSKLLMVAGVVTAVLVLALGAQGWTDHDESAARHREAITAVDQARFCERLGQPIGFLTGRVMTPDAASLSIPVQPPSAFDLQSSGAMLEFFFDRGTIGDVPPGVRDEIRLLARVGREVTRTQSAAPLLRSDARRAIQTLARYWDDYCR